jgi:peptide chain release factor 2
VTASSSSETIFDIARREQKLEQLEVAASEPGLWDDPSRAQKTMQAVARARSEVSPYYDLGRRLEDNETLMALALDESDPDAYESEISGELDTIRLALDALEIRTLLSGPFDGASAILELKPGAGGTEACDWAAMLLRMYLRWADENGFKAEIKDELPGEVAGISSATVFIEGLNAYGMLRSEHGVHRLVRISPFNANGKRQTSFAAIEVMPQIDEDNTIVIDRDDIEIDTFRASGAGGQHVNKTSSAIRITHKPSGIVVTCQNERSQLQNKELAMNVLRGKLAERAEREAEEKLAKVRGEQRSIEWGSQIRSYVFQPYTLVKDHRTKVETGDVQKVMNGDLEPFITGYLKWRAGDGKGSGLSHENFDDGLD